MVEEPAITRRFVRFRFGLVPLTILLASAAALFAQYPSRSQISKDGTTVLLEDYANLPLSSPTHGGATARAIDFSSATGRRS